LKEPSIGATSTCGRREAGWACGQKASFKSCFSLPFPVAAQRFLPRPSRYHFWSQRLRTTRTGFARFAHAVDATPRGARYAVLLLRGSDTRFWAGHYGTKLACAELRLLPCSNTGGAAAAAAAAEYVGDDGVAGWKARMAAALGPDDDDDGGIVRRMAGEEPHP